MHLFCYVLFVLTGFMFWLLLIEESSQHCDEAFYINSLRLAQNRERDRQRERGIYFRLNVRVCQALRNHISKLNFKVSGEQHVVGFGP